MKHFTFLPGTNFPVPSPSSTRRPPIMASARCLSSLTISVLINLCAVFFLCLNLLQNHVLLHGRAVDQQQWHSKPPPHGDAPLAPVGNDQRTSHNHDDDDEVSDNIALTIPRGTAQARPAARLTTEQDSQIRRAQYGGKGDRPHLGGFTEFDAMGVSPTLWTHMVRHWGIKSVLDVGCGRGISTAWFITHGLEFVQCVEGSHDAVLQSIVPNATLTATATAVTTTTITTTSRKKSGEKHTVEYPRVVEHDFSLGPWWPPRTVDAVWCVEFTEHVGRNYQPNYLPSFRSAALIFVTHSNWGGWHHVEVHDDEWWRVRWEAAGLVYSQSMTDEARAMAMQDSSRRDLTRHMTEDYMYFVGQHLWLSLQVFINPMVASLPRHSHLFAEHGCFGGRNDGEKIHVDCSRAKNAKGEHLTPLPESFKALNLTKEMDDAWLDLIKDFKAGGRPRQGNGKNMRPMNVPESLE
eukprot:CCRYP_006663-RA/>CCRYP_006663-RA protein AED:0.15 eAED:0.15 QI:286/1/1/1/0.66/0.5/4/493/463